MPKKLSKPQKISARALTPRQIKEFQQKIWHFYRTNGRSFPWRETKDSYRILVSELMLQQTQTDRVVPKYNTFIKKFPTLRALALATRADVLKSWSGLGYNRRAKFLHEAARIIVNIHQAKIPSDLDSLTDLPGIGEYTANAILAFAFNFRAVCIETNIRTLFIHQFFKTEHKVSDAEILPLIEKTMPPKNFRDWYYALMDYGAEIKKKNPNLNARSRHYSKQSPFKGSRREIRGLILKTLTVFPSVTAQRVCTLSKRDAREVESILSDLAHEGLITKKARSYSLSRS